MTNDLAGFTDTKLCVVAENVNYYQMISKSDLFYFLEMLPSLFWVRQLRTPAHSFSQAFSSVDFSQLGNVAFVERMRQNLVERCSEVDIDSMVTPMIFT